MKLYFGGAFQGKRELMKKENGIREEEIGEGGQDFDPGAVRAVDHYEEQVRKALSEGKDPMEELSLLLEKNPEVILVMREMGQGVLPAERAEREYIEKAGRVLCEAAERAKSVTRVLAGIPMRLKDGRNDGI